jgi:hypothetical protein
MILLYYFGFSITILSWPSYYLINQILHERDLPSPLFFFVDHSI